MAHADVLVPITIRNAPKDVRDALAVRAARQRQSMQTFLRHELQRIAPAPRSTGTSRWPAHVDPQPLGVFPWRAPVLYLPLRNDATIPDPD